MRADSAGAWLPLRGRPLKEASARAKPRTIAIVHDYVGALAQSMNRLAWLRGPESCPKAEILDLRSGRRMKISSRRSAACGLRVQSFGLLAFDGNRVLWQAVVGYGNTETDNAVFSAALSDRRTRSVGGGALGRNNGLDYRPPFPMTGAAGHLLFYERCEVDCNSSEVLALQGRRRHRLFTPTRPAALAVAGRRLAVLEDRVACCQRAPAWSPDGKTIAWLHNGELLTASSDGSERRVVAAASRTTGYVGDGPTWAADGSQLAFSRYIPDSNRSLVEAVMADGTGERALVEGQSPQWSPDGTEIAFVRDDDVYRMDRDGSHEARLTSDAVTGTGPPRWSPDSKKLLVSRGSRAYLVDAVAGGDTALAPDTLASPVWSPDGTSIAFTQGGSLAVMNADGSGVHLLTDNSHNFIDSDSEPAWSSDGSKVTYTRQHDETTYSIYVINVDGTGNHRVSGDPNAGEPAWAPGRSILAWGDSSDWASYRIGGLFVGNDDGSGRVRLAGRDEAMVEFRGVRTGALIKSFIEPGSAITVAISAKYLAVVTQDGSRLELHRYRADGAPLGSAALPAGVNPYYVTIGAKAVVYATEGRIFETNAETGRTKVLTTPAARPVGLSILNRRVVWAENLGKKGARIRAIGL